jgi:hypothetical protein
MKTVSKARKVQTAPKAKQTEIQQRRCVIPEQQGAEIPYREIKVEIPTPIFHRLKVASEITGVQMGELTALALRRYLNRQMEFKVRESNSKGKGAR